MCTYLAQRGSTYYYRRVIPTELRPMLGKAEFMMSLRTKDRAQAKRLIPGFTIETDRLLDDARRKMAHGAAGKPAQGQSDPAGDHEVRQLERASEGAQIDHDEAEARQARYDSREPDRAELLKHWNERHTRDLTVEEATARDLWREMREERDLLQNVSAWRFATERTAMMDALPPAIGNPIPAPAADTGTSLDTIVDKWAAERKVEKKTKDAHRAVARWFCERVGSKAVEQITRKDVLAFKDALVSEGQSAPNVKTKLERLRALLQWATDNGHLSENVGSGVTIRDIDKARRARLPFDLAALNRIFASPICAQGARPIKGRGEAAYWLPLMALYTGARLEELGQLRPGDVHPIDYPDGDGVNKSS